jgi:UDP-N-acetylmuramoyl-L-alanyl-D-glutamate--2,6-diaminopimelate ligase
MVSPPDTPPSTIEGITDDSRRVAPGWLFCAVEGTAEDGHRYLPDAVSRGAAAALVSRPSELPIPQIVVR